MAHRPDGNPRWPLLVEEDDWFRTPSEELSEPGEVGEVAWQDEPESLPQKSAGGLGRRRLVVVLAVIVAVVIVAAGTLLVRVIAGSGGATATSGSTVRVPTTPAPTTPVQTSPHPTAPSVTTTPSPTSVPTDAVLRLGSTGAGVKRLQQALSRLGDAPGAADGSLGPATVKAVIAFQNAHGLLGDGIAGAKTLAAINTALGP